MGQRLDEALSLRELCRATKQCKKGVLWKDSVANHYLRSLTRNQKLSREVKEGRYKLSPYTVFTIHEPKKREISATKMRDRVLQRSMTNNGVRDDLTRSFIYDNGACIKNKGKDFTVCRTQCALERYYRKHRDRQGYAAHLDVKSYFPNTPHGEIKHILRERVQDKDFLPLLYEIVDSYEDKRPCEEIKEDRFGERGIGLGSELSQLVQLALLDGIDHGVKEIYKPEIYIRYMDDFLVVCREREKLLEIVEYIETELKKLGHRATNKEGIYPIRRGIVFLKLRFILMDGGKVVVKISDRTLSRERKQLRNLKWLADRGERTAEDVRRHYQSWISMVKPYDSGAALRKMDQFYEELFGVKPNYKYKRRKKRHGVQRRTRTAPGGAQEEREASGGKHEAEGTDGVHRGVRPSGNAGRGGRDQ